VNVVASTPLERPSSVAVDHRERILVADTGNDRVVVLSPSGIEVDEFGGYGREEGGLDDPVDLSIYPGFYVYVLDRGNRRVQSFDDDGDLVGTVVETGEILDPVAIDLGRAGEVLVLDADSRSVAVFSQFGEMETPVGRFGSAGAGLVLPRDVSRGPAGEVAIADPGRAAVLVFDQFGALELTLSSADTMRPSGVAFDRRGNLLVADRMRGTVTAFSRGGERTAFLDRDEAGGPLRPAALAVAPGGDLLILESSPARILRAVIVYGECGAP
jgi:DNA-binding beta-propeller fold protein YncE